MWHLLQADMQKDEQNRSAGVEIAGKTGLQGQGLRSTQWIGVQDYTGQACMQDYAQDYVVHNGDRSIGLQWTGLRAGLCSTHLDKVHGID